MTLQNTYTQEQLERAVEKAGDYFQGLFLDWVNNYLTLPAFSADHNLSPKQARQYIEIGRKIHAQRTQSIK